MFKIATWNVNSLKVRLLQVLDWLDEVKPDVLALQETKLLDAFFPKEEIEAHGYHVCFTGQKTYNGMAILTRQPPEKIITDLPHFSDPQKRFLSTTLGNLHIVNVYVPNGESVDSEKYRYKLKWLTGLQGYLEKELQTAKNLVVLGDFNIAPEPRDVYDPKAWEDQVLFSQPEREAFQELLKLGLTDTFRLFEQPEKAYSWWDYRQGRFRRNQGLRIDHILIN